VRRIVDNGYKGATNILSGHRETLSQIAMALLEREVLDANEIQLIIDGKPLPTKPPSPPHDEVQHILKPEPGRQPGLAPGERPAPA
jgi:cell division protease FtsH